MNCKEQIISWLKYYRKPMAVHEIKLLGYSQNNIASRLNDLEREGYLISNFRKDKRFKEWVLVSAAFIKFDQNGQGELL